MDLRMVKTRSRITEAFLELRQKLMPEKIKVKDICEVAMINKTTFYNHYTDSMELSNEIDEHAIDNVISDFSERERLFDDPAAYIVGLLHALEHEANNLKLVFRGKQEILCAKLEDRLFEYYKSTANDLESGVRLSFAIGGFVRVVKDYIFSEKKVNIEALAAYTAHILTSLPQSKLLPEPQG